MPSFTTSYTPRMSLTDAKDTGKSPSLPYWNHVVFTSDHFTLGICKLRTRMLLSPSWFQELKRSASYCITAVSEVSAFIQVVRITASFIVASVTKQYSSRNCSKSKPVCSHVTGNRRFSASPRELRVSCFERLIPRPAFFFGTFDYFWPKPICGWFTVRAMVIHSCFSKLITALLSHGVERMPFGHSFRLVFALFSRHITGMVYNVPCMSSLIAIYGGLLTMKGPQ